MIDALADRERVASTLGPIDPVTGRAAGVPFNVWTSDESIFHVSGPINRQTNRFWGYENPHVDRPWDRRSPKVCVWAAISRKGIIG